VRLLAAWLAPDGDRPSAELTRCASRTAADAVRRLFAPASDAAVSDRGA
jgi:hypothetical protein